MHVRLQGRSSAESWLKGVKTAFHSGCSSVVVVDKAADAIAAMDIVAGR